MVTWWKSVTPEKSWVFVHIYPRRLYIKSLQSLTHHISLIIQPISMLKIFLESSPSPLSIGCMFDTVGITDHLTLRILQIFPKCLLAVWFYITFFYFSLRCTKLYNLFLWRNVRVIVRVRVRVKVRVRVRGWGGITMDRLNLKRRSAISRDREEELSEKMLSDKKENTSKKSKRALNYAPTSLQ